MTTFFCVFAALAAIRFRLVVPGAPGRALDVTVELTGRHEAADGEPRQPGATSSSHALIAAPVACGSSSIG